MIRGEVWWADLPPPSGRRPVVLLSRDAAYTVRNLVLVTPVTIIVRGIPTEVGLGPEDGLPRASVVNLDVIITIPKSSLRQRITVLSVEKVRAIDEAIRFALGTVV